MRIRPLAPLLVAAGICLSQLGAADNIKPKTDLNLWGVAIGADDKGVEAVIREFERLNPDIVVRSLSMGAGGMNPQKLLTSIVGRVPPDVINQDRFTISDWASRGAFRSLDDLIERDRRTDPDTPRREQYYPAVWNEGSYGGKVYAIPTDADNRALYWNRAIFRAHADKLRAAGLDPERPPRTWSELLAYSKVLTEYQPDGTLKLAGFMPNFGNSWLYMYAFQMNASFMSADGKTCTLDTPASEKALQFIVDGYNAVGGYQKAKDFESGFLQLANDAFITGKVAMKIDGDWILNAISRYGPNLDFATAPPPVPDDRYFRRGDFVHEKDRYVTWVGGFSLAIPTGARHVEAAWRYVKFATSTRARLLLAKAQQAWERHRGREYIPKEAGSLEANEALFRLYKPADEKFASALRVHIDLMPAARIRPATFVGQHLWDEHVKALENAAYGRMSPKQALVEGQAVVQHELDAFYAKSSHPIIPSWIPTTIFSVLFVGVVATLHTLYRRKALQRLARNEARWAYLFLSPWVIGFVVFTLGPMLASLWFSFSQYDVLSEPRWVGLQNYIDLGTTEKANVAKAFSNAAYLGAVGVPLGLLTGLAVALLLNAAVRGMRFYRAVFYMPAIVPIVASAILWSWLLAADPNKGLINAVWKSTIQPWLGADAPGWINAEAWAKPALILMGMWGAGSGMILWLAGLKGVPSSLYEAASIDGASPKQQFFAVTLPQLSPIIFFNMVMGFIGALQEFDRIYIMKPVDGPVGPGDSLLMPVFHLFQNAFGYFKMGYASAVAWAIFGAILLLTLFQFKLAPRWVHYEADK